MVDMRQNKNFRKMVWTIFNGIVGFGLTYLSGLEGETALIVATLGTLGLRELQKFINLTYFDDFGVKKEAKID